MLDLEHCIQLWLPQCKKKAEALERVQKRTTMMVRSLKAKSYEKQLKELFSLKKGRVMGHMIAIFQYLKTIRGK